MTAISSDLMDHYQTRIHLVVTNEFGGHKIGDVITDPEEILRVLDGHNESSVVKVTKPEDPSGAE